MALTLAQINQVTLRGCFLPWFRDQCKSMGVKLPEDWTPDDAELERLSARVGEALRDWEAS